MTTSAMFEASSKACLVCKEAVGDGDGPWLRGGVQPLCDEHWSLWDGGADGEPSREYIDGVEATPDGIREKVSVELHAAFDRWLVRVRAE